jgi:hypothetical protein
VRRRRFTGLMSTLALVSATLVLAVDGTASSQALRVVGKSSSWGDYPITFAGAFVKRPAALYVRVLASPSQNVDGNWTLVCSKGYGAGSKTGRFSGRSPILRQMRFPMAHPDYCTVAASGSLSKGGRVTVEILKLI